ncbi:Alpha/Beta hydrolase protein [Hyaloraphidium curvatum]|nr:Alpha/Beta hydrolase protein [Hyaloraphidium curvatum]
MSAGFSWPPLARLPSWPESKFAILRSERDVWHGLAEDARRVGFSDKLRKDLKDLYLVQLDPTTFSREDFDVPVLPWSRLRAGGKHANSAGFAEPAGERTVPLARIRHVSVPKNPGYSCLYFYGGGYTVGTLEGSVAFCIKLSKEMGCPIWCVDYSKAPETKFPVPLSEALSAWDFILSRGEKPEQICLAGDSAGGSLSLAVTLFLRDHGRPLPAGAVLICPWLELTHSLPSNIINQPHDYLTVPFGPMIPSFASQACCDDAQLRHPYLSAVYDNGKLPPSFKVLNQVGGADTLMDDGVLWALQQRGGGATVRLEGYAEEVHDFQVFAGARDFPLADLSLRRMGTFVREIFSGAAITPESLWFAPDAPPDTAGSPWDAEAVFVAGFGKVGKDAAEAAEWIGRKREVLDADGTGALQKYLKGPWPKV